MDRYSRIVAVLKVALPLLALAILATLFLVSRGSEVDIAIPFAEADIETRTRDQQITGPFFSGTTPQGDEIVVDADVARPGGPSAPAEATNIRARMRRADGVGMELSADLAEIDVAGELAVFSGAVRMQSSTGLDIRTERLEAELDGVAGRSPGRVEAVAPFGEIAAGAMEFGPAAPDQAEDAPLHILFNNGVKLLYVPKKRE